MNRADLFAIIAACHAGEKRVIGLCERFGKDVYLATLQALLDRTHEAMRKLIQLAIPEEPQTFEDCIDDDGLGNGPYKMKLTIWREGEEAWFDWSGTDPQSLGPINFYLSEGMFKMFIGVYLIMVNDPDILFNDGFYPLLHVVMPEGCLLSPRHPAALGCRTHGLARLFDVLGGALTKQAPELNTAAGYGTSPYMLYSRLEGVAASSSTRWRSSTAASPGGRSATAWTATRGGRCSRTSRPSTWRPTIRCGSTATRRSRTPAAPGLHRGGNGVEKRYVYLEPGHVSIHDDRWLTRPWGVLGGLPGGRSTKILRRVGRHRGGAAGQVRRDRGRARRHADLPHRGRRRLEGPARPAGRGGRARRGVRARVASRGALSDYGVVVGDAAATEAERARQRAERGDALGVRLRAAAGGGDRELRGGDRAARAGAGQAAALVAAGGPRVGAGAGAQWLRASAGRRGSASAPRVVVVDLNFGFTDPSSPLACDLDDVLVALSRVARRGPRRGASRSSSPRSSTTRSGRPRRRSSCARCPALKVLRPGTRWVEIDPRLGRRGDEPMHRQGARLGVLRRAVRGAARRAATR